MSHKDLVESCIQKDGTYLLWQYRMQRTRYNILPSNQAKQNPVIIKNSSEYFWI
jgi:hypothetical protein